MTVLSFPIVPKPLCSSIHQFADSTFQLWQAIVIVDGKPLFKLTCCSQTRLTITGWKRGYFHEPAERRFRVVRNNSSGTSTSSLDTFPSRDCYVIAGWV